MSPLGQLYGPCRVPSASFFSAFFGGPVHRLLPVSRQHHSPSEWVPDSLLRCCRGILCCGVLERVPLRVACQYVAVGAGIENHALDPASEHAVHNWGSGGDDHLRHDVV